MLKPCPFCGGEAARSEWDESRPYEPYGLVVHHAPGCFLNLDMNDDDSVFDAAWNTRHDEPLVEALRNMADCVAVLCQQPPSPTRQRDSFIQDQFDQISDIASTILNDALAQWEKRNG